MPLPLAPKHLQQLRLDRNLRLVVLEVAGRHWRVLAFGQGCITVRLLGSVEIGGGLPYLPLAVFPGKKVN